MTDRLQSIRERREAAEKFTAETLMRLSLSMRRRVLPYPDNYADETNMHADAWKKREDDIAYLLRLAEAGEALAEDVEHARGGCYKHYDGDNACECPRYNSKLAAWRQAREG